MSIGIKAEKNRRSWTDLFSLQRRFASTDQIRWLKQDLLALKEQHRQVASKLEATRTHLQKVESDYTALSERYNLLVQFFEYRVDQIYEGVVERLPGMLSSGKIIAPVEGKELGGAIGEILQMPVREWALKIAGSSGTYLSPGLITSPMTLSGFRLNRNRAVERLDRIEILGNETGIAVYGPYKKLIAGHYEAEFAFSVDVQSAADAVVSFELQAYVAGADRVIQSTSVSVPCDSPSGTRHSAFAFEWISDWQDFRIEFRVLQSGRIPFSLHSIALARR